MRIILKVEADINQAEDLHDLEVSYIQRAVECYGEKKMKWIYYNKILLLPGLITLRRYGYEGSDFY